MDFAVDKKIPLPLTQDEGEILSYQEPETRPEVDLSPNNRQPEEFISQNVEDEDLLGDGWVKLWRKSIYSQVFQGEGLWKVWTWCMMKANHEDAWVPITTGKGKTQVFIKRGQFIFGRKTAAKELKMKLSTVHDRMKKLANMQNLVIKPVTHYSIITVCNYEPYQGRLNSNPTPNPTPNRHPTDTNKNDKNDKNKRIYVEGSVELRLTTFLLEQIQKNKKDRNLSPFKKPDLQKWAREINLMIRRDGRDPERIRQVILWCQGDSFWWGNILSTKKLREQFEKLEIGMEEKGGKGPTKPQSQVEYKDLTGGKG